ncbi:30S ribosomal protein S6 [Candidatus Uhrbacteria bacterium CG_4_9_14_3_um_filter_36_7]|uniref:Small ribosomal subunit protein bS6 n=1 Tax=Candidatus Uhrbacteria bacterium CG_4_9_14_3_um_filter_36_7 TaxID=1975033 RepID=A0A2M7XI01_9BACT|nr:MAG: 30S ribosomal protein S6 [Candidatus Uhrbacteria bacterium CG_4_9_14_3_um_filter_36_7]
MNTYELLYCISSQYSDAEAEKIQADMSELIEQMDAKLLKSSFLGKIKLAYSIKNMRYGMFVLVYFESEGNIIEPLNKKIRLMDGILRHTILSVAKGTEQKEYTLESYEPPLAEDGTPVQKKRYIAKKTTTSTGKSLPPPTPTTQEDRPVLSIEELDKKLDEILDDDLSKGL